MHKAIFTLVFCKGICYFFLLFSIFSCNSEPKKDDTDDVRSPYIMPDSLVKTLSLAEVQKSELVNSLTLTGQIDVNQDKQVNIFSLVSGNIQDVKVQLGDYVKIGQVLAAVKSSEMAGYSNNLIVAETNVTTTKKQLDAAQSLYKGGLANMVDVTTAQSNYDQAVAQLEMNKRILKINGNTTNGTYMVKAPINGFIVQKFATNDMAIRTDNANPLFTVSDLSTVWVWANVYESDLAMIHLADDVSITTLSYPDRIFKGHVDKIMHVLDPASKVTKIRIVMPNKDFALRPQMFASVKVNNDAKQSALYVPTSALIFDHSQYYVVTYLGQGKSKISPIQRISTVGDKVFISSGVNLGDKVLTVNSLQIYNQLNN